MMNIMKNFNYDTTHGYAKAPKYDQGLDFLHSYKEKRKQKGVQL